MITTTNPLRFNIGEESRPKIEKCENITNSIFKEQYQQSLKMIASYLHNKSEEEESVKRESYNNVFAFIGERGSGKTSCMLSVANILADKSRRFESGFLTDNEEKTLNRNYHQIDIVDPSFFDVKNNILEVVIAKMFKKFNEREEEINSTQKSNNLDNSRKLINRFQITKEHLSTLYSGVNLEEDSLERLQGLAVASDLRESMKVLIDCFLKYFGNSESDILLISVDDIDLHTTHAFQMVEQIRKYMIHPNVVILMAAKLDQLALVMKLQYAKEFEVLLNASKNPISMWIIEEMVDRYLGKLIPHGQRVFLPDAMAYMEQNVEINIKGETLPDYKEITIRDCVTSLIFQKTRFLFYHTKDITSYVVPRNLRELRHIIKLLVTMDNYRTQGRPEYNKTAFKKYFFDTWAANNLDSEGKRDIDNLMEVTDAALFNKSTIRLLESRFEKQFYAYGQDDIRSELAAILDDTNMNYNISVGDVMAVIRHFERITPNVFDHKLLFMIKSIYSMKLYEYYDEITEYTQKETPKKAVLKNDNLIGYSNYDKLVGGNFINSTLSNILPAARYGSEDAQRSIARSQRRINGKNFVAKLKNLEHNSDEKDLLLIEFFAILISRHYNPKGNFRGQNDVYYTNNLEQIVSNLYFDATAFTFNLIDIKRTYNRFGIKLYEIAEANPNSILNKIRNMTNNRHPEREDGGTKSWICIRNAEILEDFVAVLEHNRPKGATSDKDVLRSFYENARKYEIKTYDLDEKRNPHNISFMFLGAITEALDVIDEAAFKDIFIPENELKLNIGLRLKDESYPRIEILKRLKENNRGKVDVSALERDFFIIFDEENYGRDEIKGMLTELQNNFDQTALIDG